MKKWFVGVFGVFLMVVIFLVVILLNLGTVVKTAVNHYGPDITKTGMHLGAADVSLFDATARLENFVLGNPPGFSSPNAIAIGSLQVDVDETTLTKDIIIIDKIVVVQPEMTYEFKGKTDNFRTIINSMKKQQQPESTGGKETPQTKSGKKIVIRDFVLKNIKVRTVASIAGGDIATTTISEIHLKNIGEKQNGVGLAKALMLVLDEVYGQIILQDIPGVLKSRLKSFGGEFDGVKKELKTLNGKLKGLFE